MRTASPPVLIPALLALLLAVACRPTDAPSAATPADALTPQQQIAHRLGLNGVPFSEPLPRPDFVLRDTSGAPFDFRAATEGRLTLLFFGYTNCPDICPVHMANLAAVLGRSPDLRKRVEVVFVGVDVPRDTPGHLREWLDHFDRGFVGLTGTPEEIEAAQLAAGVPPAMVDSRWEDGYSVSHAGWLTLYTPDGPARLRYPFGTRQSELAHDLEVLVEKGWPGA